MIETTTTASTALVPEDLSPAAVKLARRLCQLKNRRKYVIMFIKISDTVFLYEITEQQGQVEYAK